MQDLVSMLMSSGLKPQDLGNYDNCINTPDMKYALITIKSKDFESFMGYCIPKFCDAEDLQPLANSYLKLFKYLGLDDLDSEIGFPQEQMKQLNSNREGLYFLIFVISLLFSFGIIGIFVQYTQLGNKDNLIPLEIQNYQRLKQKIVDQIQDNHLLQSKKK